MAGAVFAPCGELVFGDREWAEYLFYRDNPKGTYRERWVHAAGCRKWFNAVRDTRTYEISETYLAAAPESQQTPVTEGASS